MHILSYYRTATGQKNLCLAGGVALNCTANTRILRSGLFENVFVQPAAHDGGGAYGAALATWSKLTHSRPSQALDHLYWGRAIEPAEVGPELQCWSSLLESEHYEDIFTRTAELLADGMVVGWISGRSEFGPRALGNRSIIADSRPASHKDLINAMVKKREAFRPFAPAVLEEVATQYFDLRANEHLPWMIFVTEVHPDKRELLGAITHVDGSARVQTVSARSNPRFHRLLQAFGQQTGTPVLLNTSFNNNAEPIVDSIEDAIVCFLTTGLNYLVIEDHLVRKKAMTPALLGELVPSLPAYLQLTETTQYSSSGRLTSHASACNRYYAKKHIKLSAQTSAALKRADGQASLAKLFGTSLADAFDELLELWSERLIKLCPRARAAAPTTNNRDTHNSVGIA
jgi:carbamoyltransferase